MVIDAVDSLASLFQFSVDRYARLSGVGVASSTIDDVLDEHANLGLLITLPMGKIREFLMLRSTGRRKPRLVVNEGKKKREEKRKEEEHTTLPTKSFHKILANATQDFVKSLKDTPAQLGDFL